MTFRRSPEIQQETNKLSIRNSRRLLRDPLEEPIPTPELLGLNHQPPQARTPNRGAAEELQQEEVEPHSSTHTAVPSLRV